MGFIRGETREPMRPGLVDLYRVIRLGNGDKLQY